jgi:DNA mismatch repair protein MutS2
MESMNSRKNSVDNFLSGSMSILGWEQIQQALYEQVYSPATQNRCRSFLPENELSAAETSLKETGEALRLEESNTRIPLAHFEDLEKILKGLPKTGTLEAFEGLEILNFLRLIRTIDLFFKKAENVPNLVNRVIELDPIPDLFEALFSCIDDEGEIKETATPELQQASKAVKNSKDELDVVVQRLLSQPKIKDCLQDSYFTEREGRIVFPIRSEFKSKIEGVVHDTSGSGVTLFLEPSKIVPLNNQLKIKRIEVEREKVRILRQLAKTVLQYSETLKANLSILCALDLINAKVRLAKNMGARLFKFSKDGRIKLKQARNPELLLNGQFVVANDIVTEIGTSTVVISGPNTGGKTVVLKTIGAMSLMARAGLLLPVDENSEIPFFPKIYADIGDDQNIAENLSTFSAHLKKMIHILDYSPFGSLVLLDELGVATDPAQGAALAEAILRELNERGISTFVSTHYLALKTIAQTEKGFVNACMEFNEDQSRPTFKLILGAPGRSAALETAERLGLDSNVIRRAREIYDLNDNRAAALLESLHKQKLKLEKDKERIQIDLYKAKELRKESEDVAEKLFEKEKEFEKEKAKRLKKTVQESKREIRQIVDHAKKSKSTGSIKRAENKIHFVDKSMRSANLADFSQWNVPVEELREGDSVILSEYGTKGYLLEDPKSKNKLRVRIGNLDSLVDARKVKGHPRERNRQNKVDNQEVKFTIHAETNSNPQFSCNLHGMRVEEAKTALESFIDQALLNNVDRVKINHGHGMGKIKRFVRDYLQSCGIGRRVIPGEREEGGDGVTIVEF